MPKVQPPELKKFMDKKLSRTFCSLRAEVLLALSAGPEAVLPVAAATAAHLAVCPPWLLQ
jgi:hypothetical protein